MSNYPLTNYHFVVQWGGVRLGFTEVTGLDIFVETIQYKEGSSPKLGPQKLPGQRRFNNITLKRGIVKGDNNFIEWLQANNPVDRRDVTISLLNENHEPVVTWKIQNAFPVRYSGPILKANGNEVAIEELELAHEGMSVEND